MPTLTAQQYLKRAILQKAAAFGNISNLPSIDATNVDELYEHYGQEWHLQDPDNEVRSSGQPSYLPNRFHSRHYDNHEVAARMDDGQWVGWTYWHGGGKHGSPESLNWIDDAYLVNCVEKEKTVIVHEFSLPT